MTRAGGRGRGARRRAEPSAVSTFVGSSTCGLAEDRSYAGSMRRTGHRWYAPHKLLIGSSQGGAMTPMTRSPECTASTSTLFVAFELGSTQWKLAFAAARA